MDLTYYVRMHGHTLDVAHINTPDEAKIARKHGYYRATEREYRALLNSPRFTCLREGAILDIDGQEVNPWAVT